ncbi:hypothetical protein A3K81_00850 [Candidatus Bathyarchaeota archaeon RBG_13_60_20]|jgi:hypothetical protein|nr:MAG: hypothetical protein A3K81_00850 [Candidatus Bathyarchaeota archaeon RBG_13_60_20]
MLMSRVFLTVVKPHIASFDYSVPFSRGDRVEVGREDPEMPGWYWCKDRRGVHSWVPEEYLERRGDDGVITEAYDTQELNVEAGETLGYVTEVRHWTLCTARDGRVGWVPTANLRGQ